MEPFFEQNDTFLLENPEFAEDFQKIMQYEKFPKNHILHHSGTVCNHLYVIVSGIARVFYYKEDKDITCHFAAEQDTITAIDSFIQRRKSKYNIQLMEDAELLVISHADLENLFRSHPKYEHFGRLFLQQAYVELVERMDDLQLHSAHERYEILLSKKPELFQRISAKHIATFLGMTPETFSRIRGK